MTWRDGAIVALAIAAGRLLAFLVQQIVLPAWYAWQQRRKAERELAAGVCHLIGCASYHNGRCRLGLPEGGRILSPDQCQWFKPGEMEGGSHGRET